jgi:hypothetical protein
MQHRHILLGADRRRSVLLVWLFTALVVFMCDPGIALAQRPCPPPRVPPSYVRPDTVALALAPPAATRVPDDVCAPAAGITQLPYFDDYAWRAFIALVWPALSGERGVADPEQMLERVLKDPAAIPNGPDLVFETYKADWETFPVGGKKPRQWNDLEAEWNNVQLSCRHGVQLAMPGDFFLVPSTKHYNRKGLPEDFGYFDNVMQFSSPPGVLVAQNGTFVRYLAAYNQIEPEQKIEFLDGSLSVKSAWVDMAKVEIDSTGNDIVKEYTVAHPETFHRRLAWLYDPYRQTCEEHIVGLVGFHIVQKTEHRPQWVWSTFEHVANVPTEIGKSDHEAHPAGACARPGSISPYTFNNGRGTKMPGVPPADFLAGSLPNRCPPSPVNIERLHPINRDDDKKVGRNTQEINAIWQRGLRNKDSVWQYYQLVMTQWPTDFGGVEDRGNCSNGLPCGIPGTTIPGFGPERIEHSGFANTTVETWNQSDIKLGCMGCHSLTEQQDHIDFLWSLRMNAYQ